MQKIDQDNPYENNIRMLFLHSLFMPVEEKMAQAREELVRMVWENPSGVERVVLTYAKAIMGMREIKLGFYEKKIDGRHPGMALNEDQERGLLTLLNEIRQEAREARLSRINERKEISWARRHGKERGTPVSLRIH